MKLLIQILWKISTGRREGQQEQIVGWFSDGPEAVPQRAWAGQDSLQASGQSLPDHAGAESLQNHRTLLQSSGEVRRRKDPIAGNGSREEVVTDDPWQEVPGNSRPGALGL